MTEDDELLQAYTRAGDRAALGRLVARLLDVVYSAALRQTRGDVPLAEDVTQAVFVTLARKAGSIRGRAAMASWLFRTTRYTAANALKMERRRRHHEHRAAEAAARAADAAAASAARA